jgi:hypothetical protein
MLYYEGIYWLATVLICLFVACKKVITNPPDNGNGLGGGVMQHLHFIIDLLNNNKL